MKKVLTIINKCFNVFLIGFLVYFSFFILYKISSLIGTQVIFSNLTAYEFFFLFFPLVAADVITLGTTLVPLLFLGTIVMMFYTNWIMALTAIGASLVGFIFMFLILGRSQKYFVARQNRALSGSELKLRMDLPLSSI